MGEAYPELVSQQKLIESVIREEENAFLRTLDRGIKLMDEYMAKSADTKVISGVDAFVLYDTYGFPIDLSELIATENGYTIDLEGFQVELGKQKERARNATANEVGDWTEFCEGESHFTGYDETTTTGARLLKHRKVVQKNKEMLQLVFDRTPFYGEMGGEIGDTGYIVSADGEKIAILNTIKENNLTVHIAQKLPQNCEGEFTLVVDAERRQKIANNHSCTHLLDQVLREVLGTHVEQKGSYVSDNYFRFDFSHFEKLSDAQIREVEHKVNALIRRNMPLEEKRDATMAEANAMGAIALFGEKYGDTVRVVKFGPSVELCGGCHTSATGNIGYFQITGETAIAAGVRRIEAVTGEAAEMYCEAAQETLRTARAFFNNIPDLSGAIQKLITENAEYKKQAEAFAKQKAAQFAKELSTTGKQVGGINLITIDSISGFDDNPTMVREAALLLQKELKSTAIAGSFLSDGKPQLLLMYSEDLVAAGKNAGKDIRDAAACIQGGGGGQAGFATAGGRNAAGLKEALGVLVGKIVA